MCRYARWIHKDMWHDNPVGWILHKSHHEPRLGPFEANDLCECRTAGRTVVRGCRL